MNRRAKILVPTVGLAVALAALCVLLSDPSGRRVLAVSDDLAARPGADGARESDPAGGEVPDPLATLPEEERTTVDLPPPIDPDPLAALTWEEGFDARAVYGTVQDEQGLPIAGARLALWPDSSDMEQAGPPLSECLSNAEGRYRFLDLVEFEGYRVHAEADGYMPTLRYPRTGVDEELLLARSAPFAGRVLDAPGDRPIEGAVVIISASQRTEHGIDSYSRALTDAEGRYTLPYGRVGREQLLWARRPGGVFEQREFQIQKDRTDGYDIRLGEGQPLVLRIHDVRTLEPLRDMEFELARDNTITTDAHGLVQIQSPEISQLDRGRLTFNVRREGWCRTTRRITVPEGGIHEPIELPMLLGGTITGSVKNIDGAPIAGARVTLYNGNSRKPEEFILPNDTSLRTESTRATTGPDGRFELTCVLPGPKEISLRIRHDEYRGQREDSIQVLTPGATVDVPVEMIRGAVVQGQVLLNGVPALAHVSWRHAESEGSYDPGGRGVKGDSNSNDSGAYRIEAVMPGRTTLSVEIEDDLWGRRDHTEEIWVIDGEINEHDIQVIMDRATISGVVRDSNLATLAGLEVSAWTNGQVRGGGVFAQSRTDAEGRFELQVTNAPGLVYYVFINEGHREAHKSDVLPGATGLELILPVTGLVRLEVVDAVTREHLQDFRLFWRETDSGDGFRSWTKGGQEHSPGPDGVFEAEFPEGLLLDLKVSARDQGYIAADVPNVSVSGGGESPVQLVTLDKGVTLEVILPDLPPDQSPPRMTLVEEGQLEHLISGSWNDYNRVEVYSSQRVRRNKQGRMLLKGLTPGTYRILEADSSRDNSAAGPLARNRRSPSHTFEPQTFEVPHVDNHRIEIRILKKSSKAKDPASASEKAQLQGLGYLDG